MTMHKKQYSGIGALEVAVDQVVNQDRKRVVIWHHPSDGFYRLETLGEGDPVADEEWMSPFELCIVISKPTIKLVRALARNQVAMEFEDVGI